MFHGGVSAYPVDHATTVAAATIVQLGQHVSTAEYKLNLMAPATGERLSPPRPRAAAGPTP